MATTQRDHTLCDQLVDLGIEYFPIAAGSKDRNHVEDSYGIITDIPTAISLCNQFNQDAIFWIENGQIFIIARDETEHDYVAEWQDLLI